MNSQEEDTIQIVNILEVVSGLTPVYQKISTLRERLYPTSFVQDRFLRRSMVKAVLDEEEALLDELADLEEAYLLGMTTAQKTFLRNVNSERHANEIIIKNGLLFINDQPIDLGSDSCLKPRIDEAIRLCTKETA